MSAWASHANHSQLNVIILWIKCIRHPSTPFCGWSIVMKVCIHFAKSVRQICAKFHSSLSVMSDVWSFYVQKVYVILSWLRLWLELSLRSVRFFAFFCLGCLLFNGSLLTSKMHDCLGVIQHEVLVRRVMFCTLQQRAGVDHGRGGRGQEDGHRLGEFLPVPNLSAMARRQRGASWWPWIGGGVIWDVSFYLLHSQFFHVFYMQVEMDESYFFNLEIQSRSSVVGEMDCGWSGWGAHRDKVTFSCRQSPTGTWPPCTESYRTGLCQVCHLHSRRKYSTNDRQKYLGMSV